MQAVLAYFRDFFVYLLQCTSVSKRGCVDRYEGIIPSRREVVPIDMGCPHGGFNHLSPIMRTVNIDIFRNDHGR